MLSGMDFLTRLRGTLLPEKEAKKSSQFPCKREDALIFSWYPLAPGTYRITYPLNRFFKKKIYMVFECTCNMVLNINAMTRLTCEGVLRVVQQKRNSVLRCSVKWVITKGTADNFR